MPVDRRPPTPSDAFRVTSPHAPPKRLPNVTSRDADVIVVGLGAMGAATLYQLASRGVRTLGIERFASPHAHGSSHGQTRITRRATGEGPECAPFVDAAHGIWRELEAATGETLLVECGTLVVAPGAGRARGGTHGQADFLGATVAVAEARGIAHERLDADALRRRFPMFTGDDAAVACLEPGGGYVYPDRCIAAQLDGARRAGATSLANARVVSVRETDGGVEVGVETGGEAGRRTLRADRAVVAAGAWTGPLLGAPFDALLVVRRQVLHWFATEPARHDELVGMPAFIRLHGDDAFYGFPPVAGERAVKVATEQYASATTADALDRRVTPDEAAAMHADHVAPYLAGVAATPAREGVACTYTVTPSHRFVIDEHPRMPRVTVVSACSGHGFKHSAGIGRAVAERVAGEAPFADLAPFSLARATA